MKVQDIQVGRTYHDGKSGLRKVVAVEGAPLRVRYVILAAKAERELGRDYQYVSILGQESQCDLESFARWARTGHDGEDAQRVLLDLHAVRVKLSPGEAAFMDSVAKETTGTPVRAGCRVSYDHTEGRAVGGLEKKGLLRRAGGGEVELLALGVARLAAMAAA